LETLGNTNCRNPAGNVVSVRRFGTQLTDFRCASSQTIRMIDANIGFVLRSAIDQGNWRS
jgi:hypothetical protein